MSLDINHCRIELLRGDITDQEVDAIVNVKTLTEENFG